MCFKTNRDEKFCLVIELSSQKNGGLIWSESNCLIQCKFNVNDHFKTLVLTRQEELWDKPQHEND